MSVIGGTTDVTTFFVLRDTATGLATTGMTITDIDLQYTRTGATPVAKEDATELAATNSPHADNKAKEIDSTSSKGLIRVDWPDAAFAAGVRQVTLSVTLAGSFTEHQVIEIDPPVGVAASVSGAVGSVAGNVDGSVGSVSGAVGSVAGNVDGSVASVTGNVGGNVGGNLAGTIGSLAAQAKLDVNAEADAALVDYDAPTKAEMDSGFSGLNDPTAVAVAAAVFATTGLTAAGVVTFGDMQKIIYALLRGKVTRAGNVYPFKDDDNTTTVVTITIVDPDRTVA